MLNHGRSLQCLGGHSLIGSLCAVARKSTPRTQTRRPPSNLQFEPLEDRRMLAVVTVTTLADSIDFNDSQLSLREAIFATNTVPGADTIEFDLSLTAAGPATITLAHGSLAITDSLTIAGPGADQLVIDGSSNLIFYINDRLGSVIDVELSGLTLTGGNSVLGVAVLNYESGRFIDISFVGNHARQGGALALIESAGNSTIEHCTFSDNVATMSGGAVYVDTSAPAVLTMRDSSFTGNSANLGGAIDASRFSSNATLLVSGCTFAVNSSAYGGAVSLSNGFGSQSIFSECFIDGNTAAFDGAGIYAARSSRLTVASSIVTNNHAGGNGGGIYSESNSLNLVGRSISGNTAVHGAGIYQKIGGLAVSSSTIADNTAASSGRGIFLYGASFSMQGSSISRNTAGSLGGSASGGGLFLRLQTRRPSR